MRFNCCEEVREAARNIKRLVSLADQIDELAAEEADEEKMLDLLEILDEQMNAAFVNFDSLPCEAEHRLIMARGAVAATLLMARQNPKDENIPVMTLIELEKLRLLNTVLEEISAQAKTA